MTRSTMLNSGLNGSSSVAAPGASPVVASLAESLGRAREVAETRRANAARLSQGVAAAKEIASQPVVTALGTSGAVAVLPPGWSGVPLVNELRAPIYSSYALQNTRAGHPLEGVALRVERVTGLQAPFRQLWLSGQTEQGYHGLVGVATAAVPVPGTGVELMGGGRGGAVAFVQTSSACWAIHVSAPEATWRSRRDDILELMSALVLP